MVGFTILGGSGGGVSVNTSGIPRVSGFVPESASKVLSSIRDGESDSNGFSEVGNNFLSGSGRSSSGISTSHNVDLNDG